jgi:hypothetical protein
MDKKLFLVPENYVAPEKVADQPGPSKTTVSAFLKVAMKDHPIEWQKAVELVIKQYQINWDKAEALICEIDLDWNPPKIEEVEGLEDGK